MERAVAAVGTVRAVDEIKARVFGPGLYVDCKVSVDAELSVAEGHRIAKQVKESVMEAVPACRNVLVHVNPYEADEERLSPWMITSDETPGAEVPSRTGGSS